jgi:hypothetical protein
MTYVPTFLRSYVPTFLRSYVGSITCNSVLMVTFAVLTVSGIAPELAATEWNCRTAGGACEYGFGPRCQRHFESSCPPVNICEVETLSTQSTSCGHTPVNNVVASTSAEANSLGSNVCDLNATTPAPDATLCCVTSADCGSPPSYGSPAVSCGSYSCEEGFCVPQAPTSSGTGDATNQVCCTSDAACTTSLTCGRAYCGADFHCHASVIPGCCTAAGPACPVGESCLFPSGSSVGRCSKACTTNGGCASLEEETCSQQECVSGVCHVKTSSAGKPLAVANCCRDVLDCTPQSGCKRCVKVGNNATKTCENTSGCCSSPFDCPAQTGTDIAHVACAACMGDCAGCKDSNASSSKCAACPLACQVAGKTCALGYTRIPTTCLSTSGVDQCAQANGCTFCDVTTGQCAAKTCDDGNVCTTDSCSGNGVCGHSSVSGSCSDYDPCTTGDACSGGVCSATQMSCDDANSATNDFCDNSTGQAVCQHFNVCDDMNPCTTDSGTLGACSHTNLSSGACDDGNPCTTNDACASGACTGASRLFAASFNSYFQASPLVYGDDQGFSVVAQATGHAAVGSSLANGTKQMWVLRTNAAGTKLCSQTPLFDSADTAANSEGRGVAVVPATCNGSACANANNLAVVGWKTPTSTANGIRAALTFIHGSTVDTGNLCHKETGNPPSTPALPVFIDTTYSGYPGDDKFIGVTAVADGLVMAGISSNYSTYPLIVKTDFSGTVAWKHLDGPTPDSPTTGEGTDVADAVVTVEGLTVTSAGKIVLVGFTNDSPNKGWMASFNGSNGNREWRKTFGFGTVQRLHGVAAAMDGGVYAVGETKRKDTTYGDFFVVRVNSGGTMELFDNDYGITDSVNPKSEVGRGITVFADGSFLAVGTDQVQNTGIMVRGEATGKQSWYKAYAQTTAPFVKEFYGVAGIDASNAVVVGQAPANSNDLYLMTVDVGGNYACSTSGSCFVQTIAGGAANTDVCQSSVCSGGSWANATQAAPCVLATSKGCTFDDVCVSGTCTAGVNAPSTVACQSGDPCADNSDACNGSGVCVVNAWKSDGEHCGTGSTCDGMKCESHECVFVTVASSGAWCDDGNPCTTGEACNGAGSCLGTQSILAYDSTACGTNATCAGTRCMVHP